MSEMTAVTQAVPEVILGQTQPSAGAEPTFTGDMNADLAKFAGTITPAQPAPADQPPAAVTEPVKVESKPNVEAQPAPTTPPVESKNEAKPPVEVPDKFKTADGKLDEEKIIKSYIEAERALKRSQNAKAPPQAPQTQTQPAQAQPVTVGNPTPFELRIAQDLMDTAAAAGQAMPPAYALAQARVMIGLQEAKHRADTAATFSRVEQLEQTLKDSETRKEVVALKDNHPWILTPQGQAEIAKVRQDYPHLNASETPIRDAVIFILGQRALHGTPGQVSIPNPQGVQQTAPPLPATPVQAPSAPIVLDTPEKVRDYVSKLSAKEEAEFWKKSGMKFDMPAHPRAF